MIPWKLSAAFPSSAAGWAALGALLAGGLVGWVTHPVIWLAWGPFRWSCVLVAYASQESAFNPSAVHVEGEGDSAGILQYNTSEVNSGLLPSADVRLSSFWSGYYAAVRWQRAFTGTWGGLVWLAFCALPVVGYAYARRGWRYNPWASNPLSRDENGWVHGPIEVVAEAMYDEWRGASAWYVWRGASLALLFALRKAVLRV